MVYYSNEVLIVLDYKSVNLYMEKDSMGEHG